MKKLLLPLALILMLALGCGRSDKKISNEAKELNLKFLNISAVRGLYEEFEPDTIMPADFYDNKYDADKYKVISLDDAAIKRIEKDNHIELLFKDNMSYIVMGYDRPIRELYDKQKNVKSSNGKAASLVMYRVFPNGELKTVELSEKDEDDAHLVLIILNQLYHSNNINEFNEWYIDIMKR